MRAGGYYHYVFNNIQQIFLMKEPNKHDARKISACHMFVSVTFIATLIWFVTTSLVGKIKNNGDKFYRRKSMRAADEKLIINELGP